ncbi:MAG: transposase [bacterium]|nr:transposase [bacterium]
MRISKQLNVPYDTVKRLKKKFVQYGSVDRRPGSGRPRKTSDREDRMICRQVKNDRFVSSIKILQNHKQLNISESTVQRRIFESLGMTSRWSAMKPYISETNRLRRLDFCDKYKNKDVNFWRSVIWSDESPYCLIYKAKERVWRLPGERYSPECMCATLKHDKKVNVWGCFNAYGVGILHRIEGIMDSAVYLDILNRQLLPSIRALCQLAPGKKYIFQQDNDPKHTANLTKEWLQRKRLPMLFWPSQSPDLNPIENLWGHLDRQVMDRRPTSEDQLFEILEDGWNALSVTYLQSLADSMPRRIQAVLDNNGWPTKY